MCIVTPINTVPWMIWFLWCSLHCFNNYIILNWYSIQNTMNRCKFFLRHTKCVSSWRIRSCSLRNTGRDWMTSCCRRRNWVWSWSSSLRSTKSKNWIKWTMWGVLKSKNWVKWTMWGVQKSKNWVKCTKSKKQMKLAGVPKEWCG